MAVPLTVATVGLFEAESAFASFDGLHALRASSEAAPARKMPDLMSCMLPFIQCEVSTSATRTVAGRTLFGVIFRDGLRPPTCATAQSPQRGTHRLRSELKRIALPAPRATLRSAERLVMRTSRETRSTFRAELFAP